jgi:hypothetical protein
MEIGGQPEGPCVVYAIGFRFVVKRSEGADLSSGMNEAGRSTPRCPHFKLLLLTFDFSVNGDAGPNDRFNYRRCLIPKGVQRKS